MLQVSVQVKVPLTVVLNTHCVDAWSCDGVTHALGRMNRAATRSDDTRSVKPVDIPANPKRTNVFEQQAAACGNED